MRYLTLQVFILLTAAIGLLLMSGCAPRPRVVAARPFVEKKSAEVDSSKMLENLPVEVLLEKGRTYLEQENLPLAQLHLFKALTNAPGNIELYQLLGVLFLKENQLEKSKNAYAEALKLSPGDPSSLLGLGKVYRLEGSCAVAGNYLQQARRLTPTNPDVLTEMAICHDTLEQSTQAEELYLRVAELQPQNPSSFNNLGFHYLIQGAYPQAIDAFLRGARLEPEDRLIKNNLAAAYILNGDEGRGLSLFENSIGQAGAYNNAGYIYMVQNRWQDAEAAFIKALELNPRYYVKAAKNLDYLRRISTHQSTRSSNTEGVSN